METIQKKWMFIKIVIYRNFAIKITKTNKFIKIKKGDAAKTSPKVWKISFNTVMLKQQLPLEINPKNKVNDTTARIVRG